MLKGVRLLGGKCVDCNNINITILEFHHKEPANKDKEVSILCRISCDWQRIKQEVLKCELLCCNCHKIRHFNQELYNENIAKIITISETDDFIECKRWSNKETQQLIELYNKGKARLEIALELQRHKEVITKKIRLLIQQKVLQKRNKRISPDRKVSLEMRKKIIELSVTFGGTKLSRLVGLSKSTIYRILKEK